MKKLLLLFGLVLTFGFAHAQSADQPTNEQRAHTQAMNLKKRLSLTDDQTVRVEQVCLSGIVSIEAIKHDQAKTESQQKTEIDQVKADKEKELETILTPEQFAQYKTMKQERANRQAQSGQ